MTNIPIYAAQQVAKKYDYDQVIIIARKVGEGEHCTTYGIDAANCAAAAKIGAFLTSKIMGWAEEMTLTDVIFFLRSCGFYDAAKALETEINSICICYRTDNQLICPTCGKEKRKY